MGVFKLMSFSLGLLLSLNGAAAEYDVSLDSKEIKIGNISHATGDKSYRIFRGSDSPEKIKIYFQLDYYRNECVRYDTVEHWVEGHYSPICIETNAIGDCIDWGEEWVDGYYDTTSVCVEHQDIKYVSTRKLKLNFKKAKQLTGDQYEVYEFKLAEKGRYSVKSILKFKAISTEADYKIKFDTDSEFKHSVEVKML
ncbi:MAG: hypothetical protein HOE90_03445 [Bacteriovoracaceae bacterium]|jgi:hypothetical protein|nr:hypothetical protein [Bacteriovoracaceae bacterium]